MSDRFKIIETTIVDVSDYPDTENTLRNDIKEFTQEFEEVNGVESRDFEMEKVSE